MPSVVRPAIRGSSSPPLTIGRVLALLSLSLSFSTQASAQTPIACGQTLSGTIAAAGQQDTYGFSGNAGEAVIFAAVATSGTLAARADLYGPTGVLLGISLSDSVSVTVGLPSTGTHTIVVRDAASTPTKTGGYNVSLRFTSGRCGTAMACGQTLGGTITGAAQLDSYSFSGNAGEAVIFAAVATSGTLAARADLYGPTGVLLGISLSDSVSVTVGLPSTGTHTIVVRDAASTPTKTGGYNVSLRFTSGRCGTAMACGQTLGGTITGAAQLDSYSFSGNAGEAVIFAAVATSGTLAARADLYGPTGVLLGISLSDSVSVTVGLPSTGTHTIVVRDAASTPTKTGGYNVSLRFTSGRCGTAMACGQTLGGTITGAAQLDSYSFSGNAGEAVIFAAVATSGTLAARADLYGPTGVLLGISLSDSVSVTVGLPSTGTHTIVVRDAASTPTKTGGYNVSLRFTSGRCGTAMACGQTLGGTITGAAQLDSYSFSGNAGEAVIFAAVATSGTLAARADLYGPTGVLLGISLSDSVSVTVGLPSTGTHTIVVRDAASTPTKTGGYNVSLRFTSGRCGTAITRSQAIGATIAAAAQLDAVVFCGVGGAAAVISAVATSGTLAARAELYGPMGTLLGVSLNNSTSASITLPSNGTYTIVVRDSASAPTKTGGYNVSLSGTGSTCALPGPDLNLDRTELVFGAVNSAGTLTGLTPAQQVILTKTGGGAYDWYWTVSADRPWIQVSPSSGLNGGTLSVSITNAGGTLPATGTVEGVVTLQMPGATNSPRTIRVILTLSSTGATRAPFGIFDTPVDNTIGVTGSIAVTGWALDDLGVARVRLLRDPTAGEGSSQIFIGNAVFVDGSRPDVAMLNPTLPRSTRAGWGYLLLTNFLPNQGNGTFRLSAYADDEEGNSTLLGSKTITCANSTAMKPFGAIDTPAQGETVSGTSYNNFGWVLARGPALAYAPFGTVFAVIDGIFRPSPTGWVSRSDLTALFPQATYPGVTNALGVWTFDTTALTNGVHTIAWVVTANNGEADGIGSRYFSVTNSSSGFHAVPPGSAGSSSAGFGSPVDSGLDAAAVHVAPLDRSSITGRRGWDVTTPFRTYAADASGRVTISGEELDRIELHLGSTGDRLSGYLRIGNQRAPLPIGSHLDPTSGVFTWQPGVGFVHSYNLVFVRCDGAVAQSFSPACLRREIRIVLNPKGSNRVGPQVVIDAPSGQQDVTQPFVVAGWAIDLDGGIVTGVDALHVWAYPVSGMDPIFLGAAAYGGERPDVAALFGDRFTESGYGLTVDALPPGSYDLAVFAWSTAQHRFVPAKVVRVTVH